MAAGGLNTSKNRDGAGIYRVIRVDKPQKTGILAALVGKSTGGWPRARPERRQNMGKTSHMALQPSSAMQADQASDQVQLAPVMGFDHAAKGTARVITGAVG